jgi:hypothetical protein
MALTTRPYSKRIPKPERESSETALRLTEDIMCLEMAKNLLQKIDTWNITASDTQAERDFGRDMLCSQITLVKLWQRYARSKLKKYLAR